MGPGARAEALKSRRRLGQPLVDVHEQLVDSGRVSCIASVRRGLGLVGQPRGHEWKGSLPTSMEVIVRRHELVKFTATLPSVIRTTVRLRPNGETLMATNCTPSAPGVPFRMIRLLPSGSETPTGRWDKGHSQHLASH